MVHINDLSREIAKQLAIYTREVKEGMEEAKAQSSKNLVKELRQTSPKQTGDYRKGWRTKKVGNAMVVYNKTDYQLTHLLEKGHVKRGGGRVGAKVHIRPAEEKAIAEFLKEVQKVIQT